MELTITQDEYFIIKAALMHYKGNTETAIKQLESNIEGVASGRLCLWGKQSKEEYINNSTKSLDTRKQILNEIVEFQTKIENYGNR